MPRHKLARFSFAVIAAVAFVACSDQSPVAPGATPDGIRDLSLLAQGVQGSYELELFLSGSELILKAHVSELVSGEPAQGGRVIFQVCLLKGGPTLQMVPLPSSECDSGGSGNWVHLAGLQIDAGTCPGLGSGFACLNFGIAPSTATVGFRFRYIGQGSGIANGVSDPQDFVP